MAAKLRLPALVLLATALVTFFCFHGVAAASTSPPLNASSSGGGGFSLRLVSNNSHHRYTDLDSLQRAKQEVRCRIAHRFAGADITAASIRTYLCPPASMVYAVAVGVGTEHGYENYELEMDMAAGFSWMQCAPCHPCLPQLNPVFDPAKSPTFRPVSGHNAVLCRPPYHPLQDGRCGFGIAYRNGASAAGYLARDTFSFPTGDNNFQHLPGIVFGCANRIARFDTHGALAGVLGMGMGAEGKPLTGFMRQLYHNGGGRFSYCPIVPGTTAYSFLRFGNDIPSQPPAGVHRQSMAVLAPTTTSEAYYVKLAGISVGALRVPGVTPEMFERDQHGRGGCAIDIGTKMTAIVQTAYAHVEAAVRGHLQRNRARFVQSPGHHLCVHRTPAIEERLPSMTLHFVGGPWLRVKPQHLFLVVGSPTGGGEYLCLGLVPDAEMTVIGAMQQIDTRFIFDLHNNIPIVSFNPEDCHLDA
ncbi:hypothetical protein BRADI_1g31813v3, partial [Brachypodium distachyon]